MPGLHDLLGSLQKPRSHNRLRSVVGLSGDLSKPAKNEAWCRWRRKLVRPTLGKEPAAEDANPVGYLSGDTGIGLATFSYRLCVTPCLQTLRRLTIICLICPALALLR